MPSVYELKEAEEKQGGESDRASRNHRGKRMGINGGRDGQAERNLRATEGGQTTPQGSRVGRALGDIRIGKRLAMGFGILMFLLVCVAGAGYWGATTISNSMMDLLKNDAKAQDGFMIGALFSLELRRYEKDAILALDTKSGPAKALENWKGVDDRMHESLDELGKIPLSAEEKDTLNSIRMALKDYEQGFQSVIQKVQAEAGATGKGKTASTSRAAQANEELKPAKDAIHFVEEHLRQASAERDARIADRQGATENLTKRVGFMISGVVLVALFAVAGISVSLTRSITQPVAEAVEATGRILQGDPDVEVDTERKDEMGQLMGAVKQMSDEFGARMEAMARISSMVENAPVNLMCTDMDLRLRYMNAASRETLKKIEHLLPVKVDEMMGKAIDIFHKNPEHQRRMLATDKHLPHEALIEVGPEKMHLRVSAVYDDKRNYIGPMVTWELATQRLKAEEMAKEEAIRKQREQEELRQKVSSILDVVKAAEKGDLTQEVTVRGADAIGQMGEGLSSFFGNLRESVAAIARNSQGLASASEELSAVSQQMSVAAEETSSQANVVSAAAEQVDKNLQTVATGTEEMGASIKEIAKNATEAAKVANSAVGVADKTNQTVMKLGESSAEIGEVIKVITSIAQQTNLLALNATIEAARAGEAGKGFAVVANEVKELAKETAKATEDISRKIETIQTDTKEAVEAIGSISSIINQVNDISSTIASAVEEQNATTNEMTRNVSDAARGSGEITKNISGVAEAAQSTTHGAGDSQKAAQQLAKMANEMKELTGRFKY
ncbi:MAG TPA: methyl-accepting chemotaxis protein [Candidatus Acidoferrum sp.]|nr:methyl-accepting chemotaxis protein [Candidatus Acidoferrum sp.]